MRAHLWPEVYRPTDLTSFIFQSPEQQQQIETILGSGELPHLLLAGRHGTGKTTLARLLIRQLRVDPADLLELDASMANGVDMIHEAILSFVSTRPMGPYKVVHLQEMDYLSSQAQGLLRVTLEESFEVARFICTCNLAGRIIPALRSRFQEMLFKGLDPERMFHLASQILTAEKVQFELEDLAEHVAKHAPDMRKLLISLKQASPEGQLLPCEAGQVGELALAELLQLLGASDFAGARQLALRTISADQYPELYEQLFLNLGQLPQVQQDPALYEKALIILNDYQLKQVNAAVPELNLAALFAELSYNL